MRRHDVPGSRQGVKNKQRRAGRSRRDAGELGRRREGREAGGWAEL